MRFADLLALAFRGLFERKLRTFLALLGVVIASVLIILCLAASEGMHLEIARQFDMGDRLRRIRVFAGQADPEEAIPAEKLKVVGEMSEAKRKRIKQAIIRDWNRKHFKPKIPLTSEKLRELEAIPHVAAVEPNINHWGMAVFADKVKSVELAGVSVRRKELETQLIAGRRFRANDESSILIHEYMAYQWGYRGDKDVEKVLGKTLRLEFHTGGILGGTNRNLADAETRILGQIARKLPKLADRLPLTKEERAILKKAFQRTGKSSSGSKKPPPAIVREFKIIGVFREPDKEPGPRWRRNRNAVENVDVVLPLRTAEDLVTRLPHIKQHGFNQVTLIVDENENVAGVVEELRAKELNFFALTDILERVQLNVKVMTYVMAILGGVALFVAGLGIANTMVMTVLERTHEIGVMKAIGARDGDVQRIFLVEGAFLGFLGGGLGLLIGWGASFPINAIVVQRLSERFQDAANSQIFAFPWWLIAGVPTFAAFITMLAAVYPARRAAKIDPIAALRHD